MNDIATVLKKYPELSENEAIEMSRHWFPSQPSYGAAPNSKPLVQLDMYVRLRKRGEPHRFALMLATRKGPKLDTNKTHRAGVKNLADQGGHMEATLREAIKYGYKPQIGDVYEVGLARFVGDPKAFVPYDDPKGYVKKYAETTGRSVCKTEGLKISEEIHAARE